MAPVAVEPREIKAPGESPSTAAVTEGDGLPESAADEPEEEGKGSFPLIPLIAAGIGLVVLVLLVKVLKSK